MTTRFVLGAERGRKQCTFSVGRFRSPGMVAKKKMGAT
jgi:hypothetical protein